MASESSNENLAEEENGEPDDNLAEEENGEPDENLAEEENGEPDDNLAKEENYKKHNTIKFLIGITPNRVISYLSRCWGGRPTDSK